jgi:hypothetical protein
MYRPPDAAAHEPNRWPLERALFAIAGSVILVSVLLGVLVSPWFLILTALVGVNQWVYVLAGDCPVSVILKRTWGLKSAVYPEQAASRTHSR